MAIANLESYAGFSKRVDFITRRLKEGATPINIVTSFNKEFSTVNIVVPDDTKKKLGNDQTLINKCYVNEMYKKLDYWQGLVDDYVKTKASSIQTAMEKERKTLYSKETYDNYITNLEYVRRMTSDRRTIKEMMQVINPKSNNPDQDFYNYVETRNNWVQVYQKELVTRLKKELSTYLKNYKYCDSVVNSHIGKIIGRSESYVRLLLSDNQAKLNNKADSDIQSLFQYRKQKAKALAEKDVSVKDIASNLNLPEDIPITDKNTGKTVSVKKTQYVQQYLLTDKYMKDWAKRLADSNTSVKVIADKLGHSSGWVRDTALKIGYMKAWAKKLAYSNTTVIDILKQFDMTDIDANRISIRSTYLEESFCKAWVLRRLRSGDKMSKIASMLGYDPVYKNKKITKTAAQVLKDDKSSMPSESKIKDIARNIADGNRTVAGAIKIIQARLDAYELADIVKLLGPSYIMSWVQALDNKNNYKGKYYNKYNDIQKIVDPVSKDTVEKYAAMASKSDTWKTGKNESIAKYINSLKNIGDNNNKKRRVKALVKNVNTTMTTIRNDDNMKKYYGKTPSVEDIRTLMGGQKGDFFKNWAKRLAGNGKTVAYIIEALGYGKLSDLKGTAKTDVLTEVKDKLLGADYMKTWAKDLFNNESDIASIATKLSIDNTGAYNYVGEGAIKEKVKGMIRGSKPKTIPNIYDFLGRTKSHAYIRNTLLGTDETRLYLNRVISSNGIEKTADDIKKDIFGIDKDDNNYKDYIFDMLAKSVLKTWALNLRNNGKTVKDIADHIKETKSNKNVINATYVRDTLLGNEILKPWILTIIKDITKTADNVKDATGVPADTIPVIIGEDAFRSWAIRLTKYYDKNAKNKLNSFYSAQEILKKLGTIKTIKKGYIEIKSNSKIENDWITSLHSLLGKEYCIQWVLRLKDKAGSNQSQIMTKTGMDAETVKKYMAAKDLTK